MSGSPIELRTGAGDLKKRIKLRGLKVTESHSSDLDPMKKICGKF